ncbi:hypothetical protein [uncultured Desulfosarcina sp.]|uniref:hypothetical protein n=1 Tax=uncultured Desulfosarcina sp. TaxID=218289 RepID=UPI0029C94ADE|nr:hypothetical protein [uncultured Desulfosarcina sp.]
MVSIVKLDDGVNPSVAKAGGSQSQGAKGEAVVVYCNPLATPDLVSSGFPARVKKEKIIVTPGIHTWCIPERRQK